MLTLQASRSAIEDPSSLDPTPPNPDDTLRHMHHAPDASFMCEMEHTCLSQHPFLSRPEGAGIAAESRHASAMAYNDPHHVASDVLLWLGWSHEWKTRMTLCSRADFRHSGTLHRPR